MEIIGYLLSGLTNHELWDKFDNVHNNSLSNVQSLPKDISAILYAQYLNYIKLKW